MATMASFGIHLIPSFSSSCSQLAGFSNLSSSTHFVHHRHNQHVFKREFSPDGRRLKRSIIVGSENSTSRWGDWWRSPNKEKGVLVAPRPSLSDIFWPSAGAFAAMALLGRLDQMVAPKGICFTIAPLGGICAVLFAAPSSPAAQRHNMFPAQIACAAFGVLALSAFGPGWLSRSIGVAASVAFMIITGAIHPPAASLPILFIDAAKFHQLQLWYLFFPGATGCILLCLIQEMVIYLKSNCRF